MKNIKDLQAEYRRIAQRINYDWNVELQRALTRARSLNRKSGIKVEPKPKCELCGSTVYNPDDFLCSEDCANKYWKIEKSID